MQEETKKIINKLWPHVVIILGAIIDLLPQLVSKITIIGADTKFHFARFYDIAMQISTEKLSLFQTNYAFQQSGRIINALYGPFFAWINGVILLLTHSWFKFQIVTSFLILLVGSYSMLFLLSWLKIKKWVAVFFSLMFVNIGMIPMYLTGTTYNAWGQALMPWVVLCGIRMIKSDAEPVKWIQLMIIMSIIAQIHVLSTLFAVALLIPFFIYSLIKNQKRWKLVVIPVLKAMLGTIILTANVWGAYIVLYSKNIIANPMAWDLTISQVRLENYGLHYNFYGNSGLQILPVFTCLVLLQFAFVIFNLRHNKINSFCTLWGSVLLLISSVYFPWGSIQKYFPILKTNFQFPYRLIVIAYPLIVVGMSLTVVQITQSKGWIRNSIFVLLGLFLIENYWTINSYTNHYIKNFNRGIRIQKMTHQNNLNQILETIHYGVVPDYLPLQNKKAVKGPDKQYRKYVIKRWKKYHHVVKQNGSLELKWFAKKKKKITLPVIMYAQSKLSLNGHKANERKNNIGCPKIIQRKGNNIAVVRFKTPVFFYVLLIIAILSWLTTVFYLFIHFIEFMKKK